MKAPTVPVWRLLAVAGLLLLLLLPILALLAAGLLWLHAQGLLLGWLAFAALTAGLVLALTSWRRRRRPPAVALDDAGTVTQADPFWSPREQVAWQAVSELSRRARADVLTDREKMLAMARDTLETVARCYHPEHEDPLLEFTLPESLLLTEHVSARLRRMLLDQVPFSDRISARQLALAWGYRPAVESAMRHGRKAYALLRVARMVSPLNAVLAELRDRVMDELYSELNSKVRHRLVRLWIEEVGRAAIDLYSGRLRADSAQVVAQASAEASAAGAPDGELPGPLRLLVAGRSKAGKSTVINALLGDLSAGVDVLPLTTAFEGYELVADGAPALRLIDSPGIDDAAAGEDLVRHARQADLIIWVVAAHRADRRLDRLALDALRNAWREQTTLRMPPLIVLATHIDRLTPAREWKPPYDVDAPRRDKERSIRAALEAIAADLQVPLGMIVPVRLEGAEPYNLDLLRLRLTEAFDDAQRTRWVRLHRDAIRRQDWRQLLRQLAGSGRMVGSLIRR
jgi:uncharacterized protein